MNWRVLNILELSFEHNFCHVSIAPWQLAKVVSVTCTWHEADSGYVNCKKHCCLVFTNLKSDLQRKQQALFLSACVFTGCHEFSLLISCECAFLLLPEDLGSCDEKQSYFCSQSTYIPSYLCVLFGSSRCSVLPLSSALYIPARSLCPASVIHRNCCH